MLAFTDITPGDFVIDANEQGKLRITFGTATEGYETPWVFTSTLEDSPRLRRKIRRAMRERRVLKQSSGELMDWYFVPKLSEFPHGPVTNELPEEFYFKSNIMVTNRHESSSKATGEAH